MHHTRKTGRLLGAALLILLFSRCAPVTGGAMSAGVAATSPNPALAGSVASIATMSPDARAYLNIALDSIEQTSMHHGETDWSVVRDSAMLLAAGARGPADTYGAIQWALQRADKHSFLQARFPQVNPALVESRFGYLRVPFFAGPSQAPLADSLQSALRDLDNRGACGWIVDLRMNGGGNVWPMQAGIGPLLGDSILNRAAAGPGATLYVDGAAILIDSAGKREVISKAEHPYTMRHPDAPVAVLTDGATASSAEGIAIDFRSRRNTRFFGQPTAGYSSVNRGARLPDGANMVVTVGVMTDRERRGYGGPIAPDEVVEMPKGWWPSPVDAVARRAAAWLATRPECSGAAAP